MFDSTIYKALYTPAVIRRALARKILPKITKSYGLLTKLGAVDYPHYGYCLFQAATLARRLGQKKISVLEFGVAGGNGLRALEYHAENITRMVGVEIEVYGFDTGKGLPRPTDYRDLPYHWKEGFFEMDFKLLETKLTSSKLVLGDVKNTVKTFHDDYQAAPVGAILFDLDYYSSTIDAFEILKTPPQARLPRIYCYFDDIIGEDIELYNDYIGVRLAINEFNTENNDKKLDKMHHLLARRVLEPWYHQIYSFHDFGHPDYSNFISEEDQQLQFKS
ncbi:MAG: hypothetical protein ACJAVI_005130 [Candidatus Azotimanducaceae bacterium]|jgi:hypothetical protein